jgi:hypothetical protein
MISNSVDASGCDHVLRLSTVSTGRIAFFGLTGAKAPAYDHCVPSGPYAPGAPGVPGVSGVSGVPSRQSAILMAFSVLLLTNGQVRKPFT